MLYDLKWDRPLVESDTVEILKRARAMVEYRWCPRGGTDEEGGVCALVAIGKQFPTAEALRNDGAMHFFRAAIGDRSIPEWNDTPGRTQAEVLAAFDRAIDLARCD
jgi:hypothetical protein